MTANRIQLGVIVAREGKLLLVRSQAHAAWELPGGPLAPDQTDADEEMDAILTRLGINVLTIEEDFLETVHLADNDGRIIYNLYFAAPDWTGEPTVPIDHDMGWFEPLDLHNLTMDDTLRTAVLAAFGIIPREDPSEAILRAMRGSLTGTPEIPFSFAAEVPAFPTKRAAGLDVLRTLSGGDQKAEAELRAGCPELADAILDFSMGDVWQGAALDRRTRSLMVVVMLAAAGQHASLKSHIGGALNHGASAEAVIEAMKMVAVYAGFPAAVAAWPTMEEVFAERGIARPGRGQP
ncbi:MAG: carboxymuconolactone decarboxylase family protein [Anaerolineaceae bacterium]